MGRATLGTALVVLLVVGGCRTIAPVVGGGDQPLARGTISGTVRGADNTAPAVGRTVAAVEVETGARYSATTNVTGGYTLMIPKGRYRLTVELRDGETVVSDPGIVKIGTSDADSRMDIVLAGGSRPDQPSGR